MITLEKFLSQFQCKYPNTFSSFMKNGKVKIGNKIEPLSDYVKRKTISLEFIKILFENIKNKNDYLTTFYKRSLQYDKDLHIQELPMKSGDYDNNKLVNYKNIIRNMFYFHILKKTTYGIDNVPVFLDVLEDLYENYIIDYKILTPSSLHYIKEGRLGSVFSSLYFRASIMNPYLTYSINKTLLHGKKIFTPTLGWGSYFYGFAETDIEMYVGVDVIPDVCKGVTTFANKNYPNVKTDIICSPSESLLNNRAFINKYKDTFDTVFFSPPYYKLEMYKSNNQSADNYPSYEIWLQEYWEKTIKLCHILLQKNGNLCYIISNYNGKNDEGSTLIHDLNAITKKYFKIKKIQTMYNKNVHVTEHRDTSEKIILFTK